MSRRREEDDFLVDPTSGGRSPIMTTTMMYGTQNNNNSSFEQQTTITNHDAESPLSSSSPSPDQRRRYSHHHRHAKQPKTNKHAMLVTSEEEEEEGETTPLISSSCYNSDDDENNITTDNASFSLLSGEEEEEDGTSYDETSCDNDGTTPSLLPSFTHLDPAERNERAKAAGLFCTTVSVLLLLLVVSFWRGNSNSNFLWSPGGDRNGNNPNNQRGQLGENIFFHYIVVGGGPAGIIVSTKLARTFPHLRILLLESGTESQMSVLQNLPEKSAVSSSVVFGIGGDPINEHQQDEQQQQLNKFDIPLLQLNKFDIPLLWSGLASSQDRRRRRSIHKKSTADAAVRLYSSHHWPIHKLLIGRTLGGSGLHNAMIHVRALPTDLERWNLTHLWNFSSLLPHYMALESYQPYHQTNQPTDEPCSDVAGNNASTYSCSEINHQQQQPWRGYHGPVQTQLWTDKSSSAMIDPIAPLFVQSALAAGHAKAFPGFNYYTNSEPSSSNTTTSPTSSRMGVGYYEFNIRNGVRESIARAFLGTAPPPSNLVVQTGVTVTRVLTTTTTTTTTTTDATSNSNGNPEQPHDSAPAAETKKDSSVVRAFGVECVVQATRQRKRYLLSDPRSAAVVLAAGAIMTPQILANSGIGDGSIASKDEVGTTTEMTVNLPGVGRNLQDHPVVSVAFSLKPELASESSSMYTMGDELEDYLVSVSVLEALGESAISNLTRDAQFAMQERLGTLGTAGFSAGAFLRSPWAEDESPDIQLTVFPRQIEPHILHNEDHDEITRLRSRVMVVTVALLRPDARYQVYPCLPVHHSEDSSSSASSVCRYGNTTPVMAGPDRTNPLAGILGYKLPAVGLPPTASSYLSKRDTERLAWGIAQVRKIQKVAPLSEMTANEVYPGANVTSEDLLDYVRKKSMFNGHWVGSTKMGPANDPMTVVNERLSVHGMRGSLRIVDAGVIPHAPNGNTHSTVCVVASLGADLIAEDRDRLQQSARRKNNH